MEYISSQRGHPLLVFDNYLYRKNRDHYWRCIRCTKHHCHSRLIVKKGVPPVCIEKHTHGPETEKILWGRRFLKNINTLNDDATTEEPVIPKNTNKNKVKVLNHENKDTKSDVTFPIKINKRQPHFHPDYYLL